MCGTPPNGTNTVPVPAVVNLTFAEEYVYSCLYGYKPAASGMVMVTTCKADGSFSLEDLPICTSKSREACNLVTILLKWLATL